MISDRIRSAIEGLREALAAAGAIFVHSTIVHYFDAGVLSLVSFLAAIVVFFLLWSFFTWRLEVWIQSSERHDRLNGCWGGSVTVGTESKPTRVSIFNIYRINGALRLEGASLTFHSAENGTTFEKHGTWNCNNIAYSNATLMYDYKSADHGVGLCVYNIQRSGSDHTPTGYSGNFYDHGSDVTYTVGGTKIGDFTVDLNDLKLLVQHAEDVLERLHPGLIKPNPRPQILHARR